MCSLNGNFCGQQISWEGLHLNEGNFVFEASQFSVEDLNCSERYSPMPTFSASRGLYQRHNKLASGTFWSNVLFSLSSPNHMFLK